MASEIRQTWVDVADFYRARPVREFSAEADYAVHWRDGGRSWPTYCVSYIQDTGEVYAVMQSGARTVELLGVVPADLTAQEVIEREDGGLWYATLDAILEGYTDPGVHGWDLNWVRERLAVVGKVSRD